MLVWKNLINHSIVFFAFSILVDNKLAKRPM